MRLEFEQRAKRGRGGVRDQNVDVAKLLADAPDHRAHLFVFAKVGLEQDRLGVRRREFPPGFAGRSVRRGGS